jgi:hypothetical protein
LNSVPLTLLLVHLSSSTSLAKRKCSFCNVDFLHVCLSNLASYYENHPCPGFVPTLWVSDVAGAAGMPAL